VRWNGDRVVLDPAQRFFSRPALTPGQLELESGPVPAEEPLLARADTLVASGAPFATIAPRLGARYVLVLKEADWRRSASRLRGLDPVFDSPDLTLFRSGAPLADVQLLPPAVWPVVVADLFVLTFLLALAMGARWPLARRSGD
jgi:hypothetical protein